MAGALEQIALDLANRRQGDRYVIRKVLQDYMQRHPQHYIIEQIRMIEDERVARFLIAAGLTAAMQDALVERVKELRGQ